MTHPTNTQPLADPIPPASPPHTLPPEAVAVLFGTDFERGLSESAAAESRARHGVNQLQEAPPTPPWRRFLAQFQELVIGILIVAALISGVLGEWADTAAILAIVLVNGIIGFLQEERAGRALAALRTLSAPTAKVIRDGLPRQIPASELVPGDRIEIEAGDSIPADARIVQGYGVRVQEAALTGESVPVDKDPGALLPESIPLGDRRNMAYMGTVVAAGKAGAIVVATGMATELGRIAGLLHRSEPEPTPLQRRLAELGRVLVIVCMVAVVVIFTLRMFRGESLLEAFMLSVSLAVAAVPEGLPAVVTLALALGLQRMVRRNVLIRKLPSVETLGSVTVICSDKTGTLTRNEMTVRELVVGGEAYHVGGVGYVPRGPFSRVTEGGDGGDTPVDVAAEGDLGRALAVAAWCNNARVVPKAGSADSWQVIGDPTEGALIVLAMKGGVEASARERHVIYELPFDSDRKAMSVVVRSQDARSIMYTKGAPEVILAKCRFELRNGRAESLDDARRSAIMEASDALASRALRVLALAYREGLDTSGGAYAEEELVFAGLVGMIDPPRDEVKDAVRLCRSAGIRPVMITGDHPATALAIARELGIADERSEALTGAELDLVSDEELARRVAQIAVYARVSSEHKLRVVRAWKASGQIVAMTGDGINDAPAVKAADIGIAMGVTGTDVTKEASDMVLSDDNFTSIVGAVEEGRGIFDNIQKFIHYLLSCNAGEVLVMLLAAVLGWPAPLTAIQLLWINLVTDGLPALALSMEPPEREIMSRPPRPPREPVITRRRGLAIFLHGSLIAAVTATAFATVYRESGLEHARTVAFCVAAYAQLFFVFACRSERRTLPELGLFSNPYLFAAIAVSALLQLSVVLFPFARGVFDATQHPAHEWAYVLLLALVPVTIVEVAKIIRARWGAEHEGRMRTNRNAEGARRR